ncbi:hypothetical protein IE077_001374 [Cardiosporidium cionae]|uniref:DUF6832 domain-containing protein n=1 Tax=Cardiosporidium cionae TaxID=476202 RepID=A0ABQ7J3X6_9APIC|nr:hypothetical protein IE077_001374 [Cardiosporidium cionae]|eukprot:KAF8817787.1 hypothetical protein IE077_001374 [Cardiosporidium cionae]
MAFQGFYRLSRRLSWSYLTQRRFFGVGEPDSLYTPFAVSNHKTNAGESLNHEIKSHSNSSVPTSVPPSELPRFFHTKLSSAYSNPRSILKIYRDYIKIDDYPSYPWLIRCFCQLGNVFGFNSYWSTYDKQKLQSVPTFKYLIYDIIERKTLIKSNYIPRLLYAMAALEYRAWQLLPDLLDGIEENLQHWRLPTMANMILALALLGIGDFSGDNRFGPQTDLSKNYNDIVYKLIVEVKARSLDEKEIDVTTAFDWAGMSYAMVLLGMYECPTADASPLPMFLRKTSEMINTVNLEHSGWVQYFMYQVLYCTDVENPSNAIDIKKAIPMDIQELLHTRWLKDIVLNGQKQGTELLQMESDVLLRQLRVTDALINCSVGRPWDEQHCWFVGHLLRSRNLAIEYDYLLPIGPGRPKISGTLQCRQRLLQKFGYSSATIHKCFWNSLDEEEKYLQISNLLASFCKTREEDTQSKFEFEEEISERRLKHRKQKYDTWPPDKIVV